MATAAGGGEEAGGKGGRGGGGAAGAWLRAWEARSCRLLQQQGAAAAAAAGGNNDQTPEGEQPAATSTTTAAASSSSSSSRDGMTPADVAATAAAAVALSLKPGEAWMQALLAAAESAISAATVPATAPASPPSAEGDGAGKPQAAAKGGLDAAAAAQLLVALAELSAAAPEDGAAERVGALAAQLARVAAASQPGGLRQLPPRVLVRMLLALDGLGVRPGEFCPPGGLESASWFSGHRLSLPAVAATLMPTKPPTNQHIDNTGQPIHQLID